MKIRHLAVVCLLSVSVVGCGGQAFNVDMNKETVGTVAGAAIGGLVGVQFGAGTGQIAATVVGVLLGAFIGKTVGEQLDAADKEQAESTAYSSLEQGQDGQGAQWQNPDNGHNGTFTPVRTFTLADGTLCREFKQTVTVEDQTEQKTGTACKQPDGNWLVDNA